MSEDYIEIDGTDGGAISFEECNEQVRIMLGNENWELTHLSRESVEALRDWCSEWLSRPAPVKPDTGVYSSWGTELIGMSASGKPRIRLNG